MANRFSHQVPGGYSPRDRDRDRSPTSHTDRRGSINRPLEAPSRFGSDSYNNQGAFVPNREIVVREPPRGPKALLDPPRGPSGGGTYVPRGPAGRGSGPPRDFRDRDRDRDYRDVRDTRDGRDFPP